MKKPLFSPEPGDGNGDDQTGVDKAKADKAKADAEAAHKAAIEKARLEERAKLREQLEASEKKLKDLELSFEQERAEMKKIREAKEALEKSKTSDGNIDAKALIDQVTERVSAASNARVVELEKSLKEVQAKLTATEQRELRARLIAEAGGEKALIPVLVRGTTEEEIRQSIEQSKAEFDRITAMAGGKKQRKQGEGADDDDEGSEGSDDTDDTQNSDDDEGGSKAPPVINDRSSGGAGRGRSGSILNRVKQLSREDYAKNREAAKRDLKKLYPAKPLG